MGCGHVDTHTVLDVHVWVNAICKLETLMFMVRVKVHIACICHKLHLVGEHAFTLSKFVGGMAFVIIWPIETGTVLWNGRGT